MITSLRRFAALAALAVAPLAAAADLVGDPYHLPTCIVSGEKFGPESVTVVLEGMKDPLQNGRQLKFCCPKCEAAFKADPAKYLTDLDARIVAAAPAYPLQTCLVMSDEKLESDAKTVVYGNRVYRLCCKKCVGRFGREPAKWAAEYEKQVIAAQKPGYPLAACPISGRPLGDGAIDLVIGTRLVRVCCPGCVGPVKADPAAAFAKVDAAAKKG